MRFHCLTPNPALDVTYRVDEVVVHGVNRVCEQLHRPGGKGVNVARILAAAGHQVSVHGPLGGPTGNRLQELLTSLAADIEQAWTPISGETRTTVAVVDSRDTTMFNEPGPTISGAEWSHLLDTLAESCAAGDVVIASGSLPRGIDPQQIADIVHVAHRREAIVIVDTTGPALIAAANAGCDVVKPNRDELCEATGAHTVDEGAAVLHDAGCEVVITSLGEQGVVLSGRDGQLAAYLDQALVGNPTGAGDALVAGLAAGLPGVPRHRLQEALQRALPTAVAWSAAAVLSPTAGEIDPLVAESLVVQVKEK